MGRGELKRNSTDKHLRKFAVRKRDGCSNGKKIQGQEKVFNVDMIFVHIDKNF